MTQLPVLVDVWATATLALLGLVFGSFLNVVIARVPHRQSIVAPRSRCPNCGHQLAWFENIPVFSWLALRGRCRSCKAPISPRYLLVEILTALLFLACLKRFDWTYPLVPALMLVVLLVPLTFIDLEHWLLPFELTLPGIAVGLLLSIPLGTDQLIESVIGAAAGFGGFWLMELVGEKIFQKEALGGGDKFLLALLGAFLGWRYLLGIVFLSSLQGALVGVVLLAIRGRAGPAPEPAPEQTKPEGEVGAVEPSAGEQQTTLPPTTEVRPETSAASQAAPESAGEEAPATPETAQELPEHPAAEHVHPGLEDEEDDWVPGPTNIPFGPWLSLAALELLLLGPWLGEVLPPMLRWVATGKLSF